MVESKILIPGYIKHGSIVLKEAMEFGANKIHAHNKILGNISVCVVNVIEAAYFYLEIPLSVIEDIALTAINGFGVIFNESYRKRTLYSLASLLTDSAQLSIIQFGFWRNVPLSILLLARPYVKKMLKPDMEFLLKTEENRDALSELEQLKESTSDEAERIKRVLLNASNLELMNILEIRNYVCKLLGVPIWANHREIKKSRDSLILKIHPDKNPIYPISSDKAIRILTKAWKGYDTPHIFRLAY